MTVDVGALVVQIEKTEKALFEIQIRSIAFEYERVKAQMLCDLGDLVVVRWPFVGCTSTGRFVVSRATCCSELIKEAAAENECHQPVIDADQADD